jgi:hypothetical protein
MSASDLFISAVGPRQYIANDTHPDYFPLLFPNASRENDPFRMSGVCGTNLWNQIKNFKNNLRRCVAYKNGFPPVILLTPIAPASPQVRHSILLTEKPAFLLTFFSRHPSNSSLRGAGTPSGKSSCNFGQFFGHNLPRPSSVPDGAKYDNEPD